MSILPKLSPFWSIASTLGTINVKLNCYIATPCRLSFRVNYRGFTLLSLAACSKAQTQPDCWQESRSETLGTYWPLWSLCSLWYSSRIAGWRRSSENVKECVPTPGMAAGMSNLAGQSFRILIRTCNFRRSANGIAAIRLTNVTWWCVTMGLQRMR